MNVNISVVSVIVLLIVHYSYTEAVGLDSKIEKKWCMPQHLEDKTTTPEERLEILELDMNMKAKYYDNLHETMLKINTLNSELNTKLYQADWKIKELDRSLEDERRNVRSLQSELSQLRNENDIAKRKINHLENEIRNDPRNGCACLCSDFDMARFCIAKTYRVATYLVRRIPGHGNVLGLLDKVFEWIEPEVHLLEYRKEHSRLLY